MTILARLLIVLPLLLLGDIVAAAPAGETATERPKIGLVLGGGGARGVAHIGVLKELERLQIPVDVIAGTSMGALVGGLYATGMSAADLEQLVQSLDWSAALSDNPPRDDFSFRRQQDERAYPIDFELGVRGTDFVLPEGVVQGHELDLLLRELTLEVSDISDFDKLPIPFRAIAADIVTGDMVVMGSGDLAMALRASMSVPGAFAPTEYQGRKLVDGGIVGNLPVGIAREMGVDIVIAVDVEFPLYSADELSSVLTVSEQVLTIMMRKETLRQIETLGDNDVLIRPELGTFASTNFGEATQTIAPGQQAANAEASRLTSLAVDDTTWQRYLARRSSRQGEAETLAFVRVEHDDVLADDVLLARLDVEPGDAIDAQQLAKNANRLYGLKLYEHVGYRLVTEDGQTGVVYKATPKSWGPNFLQFGLALEDDFDGSTGFNIAARHTRAAINRRGAEWRTDLQLGTDPVLRTEFYQPLSFDSRWFVAPQFEIGQRNFNIFNDDRRLARYRVTDGTVNLDIGRELGAIGEIRIGAFRGVGNARVKVGDPGLANIDYETGGAIARLRVDSVDNVRFPRKGVLADLQWTLSRPGMGADNRFETLQADYSQTWSRGKNSLQIGLGYATTLDSDNTLQDYFQLGGFLRLSGLERGAIAGPHAGLARLVYYRRIGNTTGDIFETPVYLGVSAEAGNVWQSRSEMSFGSMKMNGSLFAGFDTFVGPVYLAAGLAEGGASNFYLFIGSPPL
ncbi:MAG: patatin-like phospholipase family protein [Pseudomonadota bacterium]